MLPDKFNLKFSSTIQGQFKLKDVNLLLVFQVNCPGCFLYALPVTNKIYEEFKDKGLNVLALSTAFEDCEYNNLENTRRLLERGELVGETAKAMEQSSHNRLPYKIPYDVAFDLLEEVVMDSLPQYIEEICRMDRQFTGRSDLEKDLMRTQVKDYLTNKKYIAVTFDSNNFQGTPSWVLFDKNYNIIDQWFGHRDYKEFDLIISKALVK